MKRKIIMGLLLVGGVTGVAGGVARMAMCHRYGGWHHGGPWARARTHHEERVARLCAEAALDATTPRHRHHDGR